MVATDDGVNEEPAITFGGDTATTTTSGEGVILERQSLCNQITFLAPVISLDQRSMQAVLDTHMVE